MESLINYESDDENKEVAAGGNTDMNKKSCTELDVNYDDVGMDESDEEVEVASPCIVVNRSPPPLERDLIQVLPEDAPLIFRNMSAARDDVIITSNRRNSSDMEMDEDEELNLEEKEHTQLIKIEKFFEAAENEAKSSRFSKKDEINKNLNNLEDKSKNMANKMGIDSKGRSKSSDKDESNPPSSVRRNESEQIRCKRSHSPDRRDRNSRSSRSPERTSKSNRVERRSAPSNRIGMNVGSSVKLSSFQCQVKSIQERTGITLPTYYNPGVMNPLKYAQQIQKRKLIWGNKNDNTKPSDTPTNSVWGATTFKGDNDGKMTEKFKRLMGMKPKPNTNESCESNDVVRKQEEMFSNMEAQYEVARLVTHSHRGVGLGYSHRPPCQMRPSLQKNS